MEGLIESVKKKNLWQKCFSSDSIVWSSKNQWKMISADVKSNVKQQEIKDLVAASYKLL